jgi:hypothetical protein
MNEINGLSINVTAAEGNTSANKTILTATVSVNPDDKTQYAKALATIRSPALKTLVVTESAKFGLSGQGIALKGGPYPIKEKSAEGTEVLVGYGQDFSFTAGI